MSNRINSVRVFAVLVLLPWCHASEARSAGVPAGERAKKHGGAANEAVVTAPIPIDSLEKTCYLESFDLVWKTVKETYYDSTLEGLDWQGLRDKLRPRVESANTGEEARAAIDGLLAPLNQSHFLIVPGAYYEGGRTDTALARLGECGFDIRLDGGSVVVTSVRRDTQAYAMGVRPGWEIVRINKIPVAEAVKRSSQRWKGKTRFELELMYDIYSSLSGEIGERVPVQFRDGRGRKREIAVILTERPGHPVPAFGNLPPALINFETRRFAGDIGYIRFNCFAGVAYLVPRFNSTMDSLVDAKGLVLDLRGNTGGLGSIALAMAGWFIEEKGRSLATIRSRDRTDRILVAPRSRTYDGPLAVLVDGLSISAAEFLAGGLQDLGRARLFGTRTGGFSGRGDLLRLPDGDVFIHATAQHLRANGEDVEGNGIAPDVTIIPDRNSLLKGNDEVLAAAVEWLRTANMERMGP